MKVVKITTLWNHKYNFQIPDYLLSEYVFEINNACDKADYWFVWGGVRVKEKVNVPPQNTFFIVEEAFEERTYSQKFLDQFAHAVTCRNDIKHKGLIKHHDLGIWYFNKSYTQIRDLDVSAKQKKISVVSSDLTWLPGHKLRYAFVNKLIGHFKDRLDVYGKGFNFIEDKFDALYPYEFSIAIENNALKDYFTEKIFECYLTHTVPVYYGCTNIDQYFSEKSYYSININNYKSSILQIEQLLEEPGIYNRCLPELLHEKKKVLNEYHFFPALDKIIRKTFAKQDFPKRTVTIYPEFGNRYVAMARTIINKIK